MEIKAKLLSKHVNSGKNNLLEKSQDGEILDSQHATEELYMEIK